MNADEQAIAAVLAKYQDALNQSDTNAVMNLYASDGVFMPQHFPSSVGAAAVRRAYDAVFGSITLAVKAADAVGYGISIRPCRVQGVSKATNRDEGRAGVVLEHRIGVLTCDRKGGVWGSPSLREQTRAWRAETHLQQTLIEISCAIGISGGVKAAPLGIRHGQGRLEIKLAIAQPFNSEHGTGANRTAQLGCCVSLAWAVRAEQIAAA